MSLQSPGKVINPETGKQIKLGGPKFLELIKSKKFLYDETGNKFVTNSISTQPNIMLSNSNLTLEGEDLVIVSDDDNQVQVITDESGTNNVSMINHVSEMVHSNINVTQYLQEKGIEILSNDPVTHLIHISDIHIPVNINTNGRRNEFLSVFDRLYQQIKEAKLTTPNILIVITGDLLHTKINLKPDCSVIARAFLHNLAEIAPVLLITGNHDMNEYNLDETCTLTSIVQYVSPRVYYLQRSGLYQYGDYLFAVSSLKDGFFLRYQDIPEQIRQDYHSKIIKLYHGYISGATTDTGYCANPVDDKPVIETTNGDDVSSLSSRFRSVHEFRDYPLVLLGDVHKQQNIRRNGTMAYAGSLLQLDRGESLENHGFLYWDLSEKSYTFHRVKNDYGFVKLRVKNGHLIDNLGQVKIPLRPTIYCSLSNTTLTQFEKVKERFKDLNPLDIRLDNRPNRESYGSQLPNNQNIEKEENETITPLLRHVTLEEEVDMIKRGDFSEEKSEELIKLHLDISEKTTNETEQALNSWDLVGLEFQNLFSFGGNHLHKIDFQQGVTNISAPNQTGKSSICHIIMFALFHKTGFDSGKTDILNKSANSGYLKLKFRFNNGYYLIHKQISKTKKKGEYVDTYRTDFYYIDNENENENENGDHYENLNATTSTETVDKIQQYVGTFENFIANNTLLTRLTYSILYQKPTDRIRRFLSLFGLDKYNEHLTLAKTQLNGEKNKHIALKAELTTYQQVIQNLDVNTIDDLNQKLLTTKTTLVEKQNYLTLFEDELDELEGNLQEKTGILKNLNSQNIKITPPQTSYDELIEQEELLLEELAVQNFSGNTKSVEILEHDIQILNMELSHKVPVAEQRQFSDARHLEVDSLATIILKELESLQAKVTYTVSEEELESQLCTLQNELCQLNAELTTKKKEMAKKFPDFQKDTIKYDTENITKEEAEQQISELAERIKPLKMTLSELETKLTQLNKMPFDRLKRRSIDTTETLIDDYLVKIGELRNQLHLESKIHKIDIDASDPSTMITHLSNNRQELLPLPTLNKSGDFTIKDLDVTEEQLVDIEKKRLELNGQIKNIDLTVIKRAIVRYLILSEGGKEVTVPTVLLRKMDKVIEHADSGIFRDCLEVEKEYNSLVKRRETIAESLANERIITENSTKNVEIEKQNKLIDGQIAYLENIITEQKISTQEKMVKALKYQIELLKAKQELEELEQVQKTAEENSIYTIKIGELKKQLETQDALILCREISEYEGGIGKKELELEVKEMMLDDLNQIRNLEKTLFELDRLKILYGELKVAQKRERLSKIEDEVTLWTNYYDNQKIVEDIIKTENEVGQLREEMSEHQKRHCSLQTEIALLNREITGLNKKIDETEKLKTKIFELQENLVNVEKRIDILKYYLDLWNPKGLPLQLLRSKLSHVEPLVNDLFSRYTNYRICLDANDETKLLIHVIKQDTGDQLSQNRLSLDRLSGSEYSFLNIAFKSVCNKLAFSGRSSVFIIDEAMDSLDDHNWRRALPEIFQMMKMDYLTILFISHREIDDEILDHKMTLTKDSVTGISRVVSYH